MADEQQPVQTIQCTTCKKKFFPSGFNVSRLGIRLRTCLECNARCKATRERKKCLHGKNKGRCGLCDERICEHGKQKGMCGLCDPQRQGHRRNAREFSSQPEGWPFKFIVCGSSLAENYDLIVNKWKAIFDKMLNDDTIDKAYHDKIMNNLRPWVGGMEGEEIEKERDKERVHSYALQFIGLKIQKDIENLEN